MVYFDKVVEENAGFQQVALMLVADNLDILKRLPTELAEASLNHLQTVLTNKDTCICDLTVNPFPDTTNLQQTPLNIYSQKYRNSL